MCKFIFYLEFHKSPVVTLSGEVLVIASRVEPHPGTFLFFVYTLDPESSKWSIIKSIGDEALILDLGIIVAAKDGVMKNCIYFSNDHFHKYSGISLCGDNGNSIFIYHIGTKKVIQVFEHLTASLPIPFRMLVGFSPLSVENGCFKTI